MKDKIISFIIGLIVGGIIVFGYPKIFGQETKTSPTGFQRGSGAYMRERGAGSGQFMGSGEFQRGERNGSDEFMRNEGKTLSGSLEDGKLQENEPIAE